MKWENVIPGGKRTTDHEGRREAMKTIGAGAALLATGSFVASCSSDKVVGVAYQASADNTRHEVLVSQDAGKKDFKPSFRALNPEQQAEVLIVDGNAPAPTVEGALAPESAAPVLDAGSAAKKVYLNQAMLNGVTGLRIGRETDYAETEDGGPSSRTNHYQLDFLNAENKTVFSLKYGPHAVAYNELDRGALDKADAFPDVHFFNSRGLEVDFTLKGSELVKDLPEHALKGPTPDETDFDPYIPSASTNCTALLHKYLGMRQQAKTDSVFLNEFKTDIGASLKPLSETNPTLLANLAESLGARHSQGQSRSR